MDQSKIWDELYGSKLTWHYDTDFSGDVKGKRVLELGVGTGKTLRALIKKDPKEIIAVDFSAKAVNESKILESYNVKVIKADATKLPFEDKFDVIVCNYVLNNMLESERKKAVKEMKRLLAENGKIYFEDFAVGDLRQESGKKVEKNTFVKDNGLICHFFDEEEIKKLFKGFKIKIKTESFKPFRALKEKRVIMGAIIAKKDKV